MPIEKHDKDRGTPERARSRRDVLAAAGAAVALRAAAPGGSPAAAAVAQPPDPSGEPGALDYRSAKDLVTMLAERQVSAVELLRHAVARIEALDAGVNAVVVRDFDRAHDAARAADAALARGERRPLLGVPVTVKEAFNVAGLPTTWGIPPFKGWRPEEDAVVVARLKAAGAVILGKTNVAAALNDWQSDNPVYGVTSNPWDRTRTPGGSSGGSAAALAAGYVPLEVGSDLGGSIRVPAHCCGVYGHRPTHGVVPLRGHQVPTTEAPPSFLDMAVVGPLARTAGDLSLAMDVVAGPDDAEAVAYRLALPPARHDDLRSFRVLVIDTHPAAPTAGAVRASLDRLAGQLDKAGVKIARSSPLLPDLAMQARVYAKLLAPVAGAVSAPADLERIDAAAASLPADDDSVAAWLLRGFPLRSRDWFAADQARVHLQRQWRALFREWDVVLCPPMATAAFPHDHSDILARRLDVDGTPFPYAAAILGWSGVATLPDLPATVASVGRTEDGLPIGMQIVGPHLEDRTTLAFAELMEREFGGFVPPSLKG